MQYVKNSYIWSRKLSFGKWKIIAFNLCKQRRSHVMGKEKGVNKTRGRGLFFVLKNAILRLGLRLGLGSMLTLNLKQHSLKER